jgi:hypothetical protein
VPVAAMDDGDQARRDGVCADGGGRGCIETNVPEPRARRRPSGARAARRHAGGAGTRSRRPGRCRLNGRCPRCSRRAAAGCARRAPERGAVRGGRAPGAGGEGGGRLRLRANRSGAFGVAVPDRSTPARSVPRTAAAMRRSSRTAASPERSRRPARGDRDRARCRRPGGGDAGRRQSSITRSARGCDPSLAAAAREPVRFSPAVPRSTRRRRRHR